MSHTVSTATQHYQNVGHKGDALEAFNLIHGVQISPERKARPAVFTISSDSETEESSFARAKSQQPSSSVSQASLSAKKKARRALIMDSSASESEGTNEPEYQRSCHLTHLVHQA